MPTYSLAELAATLGFDCPAFAAKKTFVGVAGLETATQNQLSFFNNVRYLAALEKTNAGAVFVNQKQQALIPQTAIALVVDDPYLCLAKTLRLYHPTLPTAAGIHPTAVIGHQCKIDATASIGPYVVVGDHTTIGAKTTICAHVVIGQHAIIGQDCYLYPHVTIYDGCHIGARTIVHAGSVIGSDGFGFVPTAHGFYKIPQIGSVIIEEDVEIGANTTIDRGALGHTRIGRGAKLDNLIQIGHNVELGAHTAMAAQSGIAGSTKLGPGCLIGGQAGIAGHLTLGNGVQVAAQAGVSSHADAGEKLIGTPAMPMKRWFRLFKKLERLSRSSDNTST